MSILDENISTNSSISPRMRATLAGLAPWLRFIGIVGLVISILALVFTLIMIVAGSSILAMSQVPGMAALPGFFFFIYLVIFGFSAYMYYLLFQAGVKLKRFAQVDDQIALEEAFAKQKTFWTIVGVFMIIYLAIIAIAFIFSIIAVAIS